MAQKIEAARTKRSTVKPPAPGAPFNEVEDLIFRRRSVRCFQKKQVPEYLVRRILEAARFSPSSGNAQAWKFVVIQSEKMMGEMTGEIVKMIQRLMAFTDYTVGGSRPKEVLAQFLQRVANNSFHPLPFAAMKLIAEGKLGIWHGAPTVILILADMRSPGDPVVDVGIAGETIVLAAHSLGLGSCWVSFCKPLNMMPRWRQRLGIRYPYKLVSSIALGFPRGSPEGYVTRETQAIDWFAEDGSFRVVY